MRGGFKDEKRESLNVQDYTNRECRVVSVSVPIKYCRAVAACSCNLAINDKMNSKVKLTV